MGLTSEEFYLINIKNYQSCFYQNQAHSIWHRMPVLRRSAVFVLLFMGSAGELRVLLTKRSSKLRHFPSQVSFPGGKADAGLESEWEVARREMEEEIGLSANNDFLRNNYGFVIEHLKILPCFLSRTFLAVAPCVGFLKPCERDSTKMSKFHLYLNRFEISSAFSSPLRDFFYTENGGNTKEALEILWTKIKWGNVPWNLRSYTFPRHNANETFWIREYPFKEKAEHSTTSSHHIGSKGFQVSKSLEEPSSKSAQDSTSPPESEEEVYEEVYDVWGLTANILHSISQIVYCSPKDVSEKVFGEEELIYCAWHYGDLMKVKERTEQEKLISRNELAYNDIMPRLEFIRIKNLYK